MNNAFLGKTVENVKNYRLITTKSRTNFLVSEPNCNIAKKISDNLLAIEIKKTQVIMNKPIYFGLLILEISKIVIHEFCYDYLKSKYGEKSKLCYIDRDSFTNYIKAEGIYVDIKTRSDNSNYKIERLFPRGKTKNVVGLMKNELG